MRVTVTGATGLIGSRLVRALLAREDQVTVLSRNPERARELLGTVEALSWDPQAEPAPHEALSDRDAIVHLAGENIARRWTSEAKRAIRDSRVIGTRNLVQGLAAIEQDRPTRLVAGSAIGYYGPRGDEPIDEEAPPGEDFLAQTCLAWEEEALAAERYGMTVVRVRTGVVLDPDGGALAKMLPPFKLGLGGPVAGGRQYVSWIHADDLLGIVLAALDDAERWQGAINATAPEPQRNRELTKALGRVLHRPTVLPVPGLALRTLYGEMAQIVTGGARVLPARALVLGYEFRHAKLEEALDSALAS